MAFKILLQNASGSLSLTALTGEVNVQWIGNLLDEYGDDTSYVMGNLLTSIPDGEDGNETLDGNDLDARVQEWLGVDIDDRD